MSNPFAPRLLRAALASVVSLRGDRLVAAALRGRSGSPWVAGAGKAVGAMALGAREALVHGIRWGVLIGKHEQEGVPIRLASHPVPDERGVAATVEMLAWLGRLAAEDEVIFLLSGGASALLAETVPRVSLDELRLATDALLRRGAAIEEINRIRRHVGAALGGRLALATRARVEVLAISDVVGDDASSIGSGPAVGDPSRFDEALEVAIRYGLGGPVLAHLERGAAGLEEETPKPGDPRLARASFRLLARPTDLRAAARLALEAEGVAAVEDPGLVVGDVEEVERQHMDRLASLRDGEAMVLVGEPTVRVTGPGRGGRSQHLGLRMARRLDGLAAYFLALGSDGTDGPTNAAGALVDGRTWSRAAAVGIDPEAALAEFDAHPLLDAVGALVRTGPTGTNLLDLHILARAPA